MTNPKRVSETTGAQWPVILNREEVGDVPRKGMSGGVFVVTAVGGCYWCLVRGGQGCCYILQRMGQPLAATFLAQNINNSKTT